MQRARSLPRCSPFSHKFCAKVRTFHENWSRRMLFFSHFYLFNHIILHERGRISGKRAATGAVKVQIPAIRPRRARFLSGFLKSEVVLVANIRIFRKSGIESSSFIADSRNRGGLNAVEVLAEQAPPIGMPSGRCSALPASW